MRAIGVHCTVSTLILNYSNIAVILNLKWLPVEQ